MLGSQTMVTLFYHFQSASPSTTMSTCFIFGWRVRRKVQYKWPLHIIKNLLKPNSDFLKHCQCRPQADGGRNWHLFQLFFQAKIMGPQTNNLVSPSLYPPPPGSVFSLAGYLFCVSFFYKAMGALEQQFPQLTGCFFKLAKVHFSLGP